MKKIALLLCGCGNKDGSEIHETVFAMSALEQHGLQAVCVAPNDWQHEVINHANDDGDKVKRRNMLQEAARIARGDIIAIDQLKIDSYAGLVIPGGFGVAKNLCNFASSKDDMVVNAKVANLVISAHELKKPQLAICIAPIIIACVLAKQQPIVTLGNDLKTAAIIEAWGAQHQVCVKGECVVDLKNKIVTTPAYMYADSSMLEVQQGITKAVQQLVELL